MLLHSSQLSFVINLSSTCHFLQIYCLRLRDSGIKSYPMVWRRKTCSKWTRIWTSNAIPFCQTLSIAKSQRCIRRTTQDSQEIQKSEDSEDKTLSDSSRLLNQCSLWRSERHAISSAPTGTSWRWRWKASVPKVSWVQLASRINLPWHLPDLQSLLHSLW